MPKTTKKTITTSPDFDFTKKMIELETLVAQLESGEDVGIAMQQFEQASILAKELNDYLDNAQNKITSIQKRFK
jgi:exodeoxyribonuclease VII small subunit